MRHRVGMLGRLLPNLSSWLRWVVGFLAYRSKLLYKTQEHNCLVFNALSGISTFHLDKSSMIFTEAFVVEKFREFNKTKLLQKSEMRKNMVMDLIYRGFIYAANYSESHYNPRRSQIKTELRYLFVTTPNR